MERLTIKNQDVTYMENFINKHSNFDGTRIANSLKMLEAYENTGISPEQIRELKETSFSGVELARMAISFKKLHEYKQTEEDGLLLRLPCKVRDTLFSVEEMKVVEFKPKTLSHIVNLVEFERFGDIVFLTREKAESALAEMEGKV